MTHTHDFLPRWRCEHVLHDSRVHHVMSLCRVGRWLYVCKCGETGYPVRDCG